MKVEFNSAHDLAYIYFETDKITIDFVDNDLTVLKNRFIQHLSECFDDAVEVNLGITFPYTIGNITFYTISELQKYILGTQSK